MNISLKITDQKLSYILDSDIQLRSKFIMIIINGSQIYKIIFKRVLHQSQIIIVKIFFLLLASSQSQYTLGQSSSSQRQQLQITPASIISSNKISNPLLLQTFLLNFMYSPLMSLLGYTFPAFFMYTIHIAMYTFQTNVIIPILLSLDLVDDTIYTQKNHAVGLFVYSIDFIYVLIFQGLFIFSMFLTNRQSKFKTFFYGVSSTYGICSLTIFGVLLFDMISCLTSTNNTCNFQFYKMQNMQYKAEKLQSAKKILSVFVMKFETTLKRQKKERKTALSILPKQKQIK